MISFFRKIRQQLLGQNRFTKYLAYAIGEIFLVVIGILIALQVNNWNENRKDRIFEKKMLREAKIGLEQDLDFFENHLLGFRLKTQAAAADFFNRYYLTGKIDLDSVNFHFANLDFSFQYSYNRGPFEAIKSAGLDKISNDRIRADLTFLYDFYHPRIEGLCNLGIEYRIKEIQRMRKNFEIYRPFMIEDGKIIYRSPIPRDLKLLDDLEFIQMVALAYEESGLQIRNLSQVVNKMVELKELIDQELSNK